MRGLILCEGFDDVLILGYYLFKTQGWVYDPKGVFSKLYDLPKIDTKRQTVEVYKRGADLIGIWAVGGKDSFNEAYKFVHRVNSLNPKEGIDKIFIIADRDKGNIEECLDSLREKMNVCGLQVTNLYNHQVNQDIYEIEGEKYSVEIVPIVIPFEQTGALETVLTEGIAETGEEEQYIVECANEYIAKILDSGRLHKYLQHERLVLKAKLSAVISITNPDRSTNLFDKVLMSWEWEKKEVVKKHFAVLTECLQ